MIHLINGYFELKALYIGHPPSWVIFDMHVRHKQGSKLYFRVYFQHHIHWNNFEYLLVVWLWSYVLLMTTNVPKEVKYPVFVCF